MGEAEFLAWLRERLARPDPRVLVGAGPDDCAVVSVEGMSRLAVTTDTLLEGTHFLPDADPADVGWKAVAVNLSDLAATGCRPLWAVIGAGLRRGAGDAWAKRLAEGMFACADRFGLRIVGGDTTSGDGPASLAVTAMGEPLPGAPLLRSAARVGDVIVVTGALGGSILGKHLRFTPRLAEVRALLALAPLGACMDISDGLALDLSRMMKESGRGAILDAARIPLAPAAIARAKETRKTPLDHALGDGEDFELLLTMPRASWETIRAAWPPTADLAPLAAVGEVTDEPGLRLRGADGATVPLAPSGYAHRF